jgi:hypothetical protein
MLDAKRFNAVGQSAVGAVVLFVELIGNIAMHEHVTRFYVAHDTFGHTRIATAYPQNGRTLTGSICSEEVMIDVEGLLRPGLIALQ